MRQAVAGVKARLGAGSREVVYVPEFGPKAPKPCAVCGPVNLGS